MDFSSIPTPASPVIVVAQADFRGDESKNQLSFLKGDKLLVLRAKPGAPWAIGERLGSQVRGLYPVEYCKDAAAAPTQKTSAPGRDPPGVIKLSSQEPPRAVAALYVPAKAASTSSPAAASPRSLAASGPSPRPPPAGPGVISPRGGLGSSQPTIRVTHVTADFALPAFDEAMNDEAPVNVFSGVASTNLDGLRYEFEREPAKHVMETDKKGKALVGAVRRWMIIQAAAKGSVDLVKSCLKGGVPVDTRFFSFFGGLLFLRAYCLQRAVDRRHCRDGSDSAQEFCFSKVVDQRFRLSTKLC
jgi:hypothetical protein